MLRRPALLRPLLCACAVGGLLAASAPVAGATAAAKPLPLKAWRKAANDVCRQGGILLDEIANEVFGEIGPDEQPSLELMTGYVQQIEPVVQQQIDSIDALREPKNLRKKVTRLLATAQDELDALVADPSIGLEGNPFSGAELASEKLKLKQCA